MVTEIGLQDLDQALQDGALLLDVRESAEYTEGHVPGARLLPLSVLPVRMHELPRDQPRLRRLPGRRPQRPGRPAAHQRRR